MSSIEEDRAPEITGAEAKVSEKRSLHENKHFNIEEVVPDQAVEA